MLALMVFLEDVIVISTCACFWVIFRFDLLLLLKVVYLFYWLVTLHSDQVHVRFDLFEMGVIELGFGAFACICCCVEGLIGAHGMTHAFTTFLQVLCVTILTLI